jgi:hypothetical protein
MKSLRRPVVYQGVTYSEYEIDFYTSNTYSKRFRDRILKPRHDSSNYLGYGFCLKGSERYVRQHKVLAETFYDLLPKSPLVSHYGLQIGRDRHELLTPTGFTFICSQVCPDHIDGNKTNNHHSNLMIATQHENLIKCGPFKGKRYKGAYKQSKNGNTYHRMQIEFTNILDKDGKHFFASKNFQTEEEAALGYNTMLEEYLFTIWGPDLGLKMYDIAYKNVIISSKYNNV